MRIRPAELRDARQFSELNQRFNGCTAQLENRDERAETIIVAEVDGCLVGFACVQIIRTVCADFPWAEMTELFVDEPNRRHGIGAALVSEAERIAWECKCSELVLRTRTDNREARSFFERCGYDNAPHSVFRKRGGGAA